MSNKVVSFLKPFLISVAESKETKQLVVELLQKYSKSTTNNIDDLVVKAVEEAIFTPQQPQK